MSSDSQALAVGARVRVRGDAWTVLSVTPHGECQSLRLAGSGRFNSGHSRTLLLPFDRPQASALSSRVRATTPRRWAHHVRRALLSAHPFGGLRGTTAARFDLLPFQLEPALAILRHARKRVLIADDVGLGKTIQTGIILNELTAAGDSFRALIVSPAGVREQWQQELRARFGVPSTLADTLWLAQSARDLPSDVNPWGLPGVFVASLDLVKRPETLRALEDVTWDLLVIDEVHGLGSGSARLAAGRALGIRSRHVVLLTATPPDSDPPHFSAIADIGRLPGGEPITEFRRTRSDAGIPTRRKSILLGVRLSRTEQQMHRLLDRYTTLVWNQSGNREDARARLAAVLLRKRALSSATSLALSVRRRMLLLGAGAPSIEQQLLLPLDEDPLQDHAPDHVIGAQGLDDAKLEREWLEEIVSVADLASLRESKLRFLLRLLARMREPAVVFTEYRDTLAMIASALPRSLSPVVLHGGLTPRERAMAQRAFHQSGALLLATDAASEGLNLHHRCRVVIHFELPWTPLRLEQRTGRVDRLGQTRTVHEILLMARDTAERLVLAPLLRRFRSTASSRDRALSGLEESAVAAALMEGVRLQLPVATASTATTRMDLRAEARDEAHRLAIHRSTVGRAGIDRTHSRDVCVTIGRSVWFRGTQHDPSCTPPRLPPGGERHENRLGGSLLVVASVTVADEHGRAVHSEIVPLIVRERQPKACPTGSGILPTADSWRRCTARDAVRWALALIENNGDAIVEYARRLRSESCAEALVLLREWGDAAAARERGLAGDGSSAAQRLVQAGLFDGRALRDLAARQQVDALLAREAESRVLELRLNVPLRTLVGIIAVRAGRRKR